MFLGHHKHGIDIRVAPQSGVCPLCDLLTGVSSATEMREGMRIECLTWWEGHRSYEFSFYLSDDDPRVTPCPWASLS